MNKKGFTLIELLSVILVMALLVILSTYGIEAMKKSINNNMWENKVKAIEDAAERWAEDNRYLFVSDTCVDVSIDTLIARSYLHTTEKDSSNNKIITNNTDGSVVSGSKLVKVCIDNDIFYATY